MTPTGGDPGGDPGGEAPPLGFERFRRRAANLVHDAEALRELVREGMTRAEQRSPALGSVLHDLRTLIRMLGAWVRADYREVPRSSVILVIAAVLYFVVPFDLIPDFLFGIGLIDDVAVIAWVARQIRQDLDDFRRWELQRDAMETMVGRSQVPTSDPAAAPTRAPAGDPDRTERD